MVTYILIRGQASIFYTVDTGRNYQFKDYEYTKHVYFDKKHLENERAFKQSLSYNMLFIKNKINYF